MLQERRIKSGETRSRGALRGDSSRIIGDEEEVHGESRGDVARQRDRRDCEGTGPTQIRRLVIPVALLHRRI